MDNNQIHDLANIAGLGRLPELKNLTLHGNPFQKSNPNSYRVDVLNLFREQRVSDVEEATMTYRILQQSLPRLDGKEASSKELLVMRERTFRASHINANQLLLPEATARQAEDGGAVPSVVPEKTKVTTPVISPTLSLQNGTGDEREPVAMALSSSEAKRDVNVSLEGEQSDISVLSSTPRRPLRYRRVRRGRPSRKARIDDGQNANSLMLTDTTEKSKQTSRKSTQQSKNVESVEDDNTSQPRPPTTTIVTTKMTVSSVVTNFSVHDVLSAISPRTPKRKDKPEMEFDDRPVSEIETDLGPKESEQPWGEIRQSDITQQLDFSMGAQSYGAGGDNPWEQMSRASTEAQDGVLRREREIDAGVSVQFESRENEGATTTRDTFGDAFASTIANKEILAPSDDHIFSKSITGDEEGKSVEASPTDEEKVEQADNDDDDENRQSSPIRPSNPGIPNELVPTMGNNSLEDTVNPNSKNASVRILPGPKKTTEFDIFSEDWDSLVQRAAEGLIPDGIPRNPVAELQNQPNQRGELFPLEATEELPPPVAETVEDGTNDDAANNPTIQSTASGDSQSRLSSLPELLPEHVWQDDSSVPSSLGTNREDFPKVNKFQLAEENSEYDGPEYCREWPIVDNFQLYFNTFVFPGASLTLPTSLNEEMSADDENWQAVSLRYPRIQLWPEDRQWRETTSICETGQLSMDDDEDREWFVRVWEEEVIPCGSRSTKRLLPNRLTRLGFHGDALYQNAAPDPHSASRKVVLCISSSALYFIVGNDKVTARAQEKKKKFPVPISKDAVFADGRWPHAVARHPFQELVGITIGFSFQKLILRFSTRSSRNTDLFTYVLLTSNKMQTVSILQELQRRSKDAMELDSTRDTLTADVATQIDNDDRNCLDALAVAIAPDVLGTVLNFSIVQQKWKHGERGTVRRVCVVTDTKLFLLDEDYIGDGSTAVDGTNSQQRLGDVKYRMVDEATLGQVAEVQAAGADPNAITIIINPLSRLSRTHRWRLLCRDSQGAERLVEDVRKAIEMQ